MLYIKMCVFEFYLQFWVVPLEIWCTTFRKFEKTCFKSLWSLHCCLVLYGYAKSKTTKFKLLCNVLYLLQNSILINKIDDFWLIFFSTIQVWNKIMTLGLITKNFPNRHHNFRPRALSSGSFIYNIKFAVLCLVSSLLIYVKIMRIRVFKLGDRKDTCKSPRIANIWHAWLCRFLFTAAW